MTELCRWGRGTLDLLHTLGELEARRMSVVAVNGLAFDAATSAAHLRPLLRAPVRR